MNIPKSLNVPNALSVFRICLVPAFIRVFFYGGQSGQLYATGIFLFAGLTDIVDGHIARKYGQITMLGRLLDPLADKLMVLAALVCCTVAGYIPLWVVILYAGKEIVQAVCGLILFRKVRDVLPANKIGKTGTVLFYITIAVNIVKEISPAVKYSMLGASVVCMFVAFASYVRRGIKLSRGV